MLSMNADYVPRIKLMGFVSYKNPWIHFKRTTHECVLYFVKSGELHMRENGVDYVLRKGDMLVLEPHLEHEGTRKHPCDYYYIHFEHPDVHPAAERSSSLLAKQWMIGSNSSPASGYDNRQLYFPKVYTLNQKKSLHHMYRALSEMLQLYRRKHFNRSLTALSSWRC